MSELDDLRFVVAVAEELHFGRAAARLGYTRSNVSHRVRKVERQLDVQLFVRTSRRVQLTATGEALVQFARDVLAASDDFDRRGPGPHKERRSLGSSTGHSPTT